MPVSSSDERGLSRGLSLAGYPALSDSQTPGAPPPSAKRRSETRAISFPPPALGEYIAEAGLALVWA